MSKYFIMAVALPFLCSCTSSNRVPGSSLYEYSYANCLYWYFDGKGYDTDDIRRISGGMVEVSDESIEKFQQISLFIKSYKPDVKTKNNIDADLYRCFHLKESAELRNIING